LYLPDFLQEFVEVQDFQYGAELVAAAYPEEEQERAKPVHAPDELAVATVVVDHVASVPRAAKSACMAEISV
jgi:hypothetical protein